MTHGSRTIEEKDVNSHFSASCILFRQKLLPNSIFYSATNFSDSVSMPSY